MSKIPHKHAALIKAWAYVDVRWRGESNGYYSEEVNLRYEEHAK